MKKLSTGRLLRTAQAYLFAQTYNIDSDTSFDSSCSSGNFASSCSSGSGKCLRTVAVYPASSCSSPK